MGRGTDRKVSAAERDWVASEGRTKPDPLAVDKSILEGRFRHYGMVDNRASNAGRDVEKERMSTDAGESASENIKVGPGYV